MTIVFKSVFICIVIFSMASVWCSTCATTSETPAKPPKQCREALDHLRYHRLQQSAVLFESLLRSNQPCTHANALFGITLLRLERIHEAVPVLERAIVENQAVDWVSASYLGAAFEFIARRLSKVGAMRQHPSTTQSSSTPPAQPGQSRNVDQINHQFRSALSQAVRWFHIAEQLQSSVKVSTQHKTEQNNIQLEANAIAMPRRTRLWDS
jgi:hypothetical protein